MIESFRHEYIKDMVTTLILVSRLSALEVYIIVVTQALIILPEMYSYSPWMHKLSLSHLVVQVFYPLAVLCIHPCCILILIGW